jgi:hypothetical protein
MVHNNSDGRHVRISLQKAADELGATKSTVQYGRDQLIARKWLLRAAETSCYALGRGP